MTTGEGNGDPRIYMAAERTFLAWIRTSIALMAFGFVIARFGVFLRSLAPAGGARTEQTSVSLALGLSLISIGILLCVVSAWRHRRYIQAIDEGRFRSAFGSTVGFAVAGLLVLAGVSMALFLAMV